MQYQVSITLEAHDEHEALAAAYLAFSTGQSAGHIVTVTPAICETCEQPADHFLHTTKAADCKGCKAAHDHHAFRLKVSA